VHLAGGVADYDGGAVIGLSLADSLEGLGRVGAHGDLRHIDVAVGHGHLGQRLGLDLLAGRCELADLADIGGLGSLSAGVGVNFGVEHEDVDVLAGGEHMVNAAVAYIKGPAVAAEYPDGLLVHVILLRHDGLVVVAVAGIGFHDSQELLGGGLVSGGIVVGIQPRLSRGLLLLVLRVGGNVLHVGLQVVADLLAAQIYAQAVLRVILEQRVCPCGALTFLVYGVRTGGSRAAPDGRAAGGVGNKHMIAEELGHKAGVAGLGAACAGA